MTDILDTIDGALDDYMSPDAMRWTPEPEVAEREWIRGYRGELLFGFDGGHRHSASVLAATLDEIHVHTAVNIRPFVDAMNRALAQLTGLSRWLAIPSLPPELTNETLRLLAETPREAAIATTVETSCSDEPVPIVMQPPEVTMPESPKVQAAIERWGDERGKR